MLPISAGRGACCLKAGCRMSRSRSEFQRLLRLGGLRSVLLGCGYLRGAILAACLMAMGDVAYPADGQGGEGSEPRAATGQQAGRVEYPMQDWGKGKYLELPHGEIVVPRGKIQAWERSPSGFFLTKGAQVAEFEKGLKLKVLETRRFPSFLSDDRFYLRVEPAYPKNTTGEATKCLQDGVQCWVYQGQGDADLPENLLPEGVEAVRR